MVWAEKFCKKWRLIMPKEGPTAIAPAGAFQGAAEHGVCVWRGIRYAQAPTGPLRFRAPQPIPPASGEVEATTFGSIAPQLVEPSPYVPRQRVGPSEDCLFLNVWSPAPDEKKRPVYVWIHGGAFMNGAGSLTLYNGSHLASRGDIVVVTINYRVGPLGFLYLDEPSAELESNLGLKDQVAALHWVRENIAAFGGDPDCVTLAGESAGASSVVTLLAVPQAKGLFHRAVAESPAATELDRAEATRATLRLLEACQLTPSEAGKLRDIPSERLVQLGDALMKEHATLHPGRLPFAPVVDGDFLPSLALDAIRQGSAAGIPLLIGTNHDEAALFARDKVPILPTTPTLIGRTLTQRYPPEAAARLIERYWGFGTPQRCLSFAADFTFVSFALDIAEAQAAHAPVWMYRFDWSSLTMRLIRAGAVHGIEICFVFGTMRTGLSKLAFLLTRDAEISTLAARMQRHWLAFARGGTPAETWPQYSGSDRATMLIDNVWQVAHDPSEWIRTTWSGLSMSMQAEAI